jgi:ferredoxin
MRIVVDHDACQGHGRCYDLAPEVFEADDEGYVVLLVDGDLPAELEDPAANAVRNCPERALRLEG